MAKLSLNELRRLIVVVGHSRSRYTFDLVRLLFGSTPWSTVGSVSSVRYCLPILTADHIVSGLHLAIVQPCLSYIVMKAWKYTINSTLSQDPAGA